MDTDVFVLLDDCQASAAQPSSRLYRDWVETLRCTDAASLDALWQTVEIRQRAGLHAVLLADYEWGCALQQVGQGSPPGPAAGALQVLLFRRLDRWDADAVADWLARQDGGGPPSPAGVAGLHSGTDRATFDDHIDQIRQWIAQGETYQINYTLRLYGQQYGPPVALYRRLRAAQPVPFGALVHLPPDAQGESSWILSCSPELFVQHAAGTLTARPMKGTAARHKATSDDPDAAQDPADQAQATWLQNDAKNRAENVMIVDLLRNDLGRIAETGSVQVPHLFAVESYATVHQMTSTVCARPRPSVDFPQVLRALFPCGSITGAPKLHTMDLIARLEPSPRGLYCGSIGWIDAPSAGRRLGDFCLSVAIRSLLLGAAAQGMRPATLGVGSGVVRDSVAADEYAETQAKARFLTGTDPGFTLFETMRVAQGRIHHLAQHLERLQHSAAYLGFAYDLEAVQAALHQAATMLPAGAVHRLRLDLQARGAVSIQTSPLMPLPPGPAGLVLHRTPLPAHESMLLQHKTSIRSSYDAAIRRAQVLGAFDAIFLDADGWVSEGARSTLWVRMAGRWYTPPLSSGVLRGVLRGRLLQRSAYCTERSLRLEDVMAAEACVVCSALRGLQRATWLRDAHGQVLQV